MPLFAHVALGVFLGLIAAAFVIWRVAAWRADAMVAEAAAAISRADASLAQAQRQTQEASAQQELARRVQAASAQRAEELARQRLAEASARREAAWASFYRKTPACDESRGGSWTVDCANEFMRAKKKFSELYDAGRL